MNTVYEPLSPQDKKDTHKFIDHTAQEYERLRQLYNKASSSGTKIDEHELHSAVTRFEEAAHREKARVDSNLLQLTSMFTKMVHETRNKVFKHLDEQLAVFRDNVELLRGNLSVYNQEVPYILDFHKTDFANLVNQTTEPRRIDLIEEKLREITNSRRAVEASQRAKRYWANLVEKVRSAPQLLQKRNDEGYSGLFNKFETSLHNLVEEYAPRGFKSFKLKRGPTQHLEASSNNFFKTSATPLVHYFEPESKNLHFIILPSTAQGQALSLARKKVELDIDFSVAPYHGSIVTPEGRVFIFGGTNYFAGHKSINKCYEYDEKSLTLIRRANMITERHGFSFTYSKGKIYVFGGVNPTGVLKSCEVYEISADRWISLPNLSTPSAYASACNYKDKFIYKFGGYREGQALNKVVERYSIQEGTWTTLGVQYEQINALCSAAQINPNEILVFGGVKENGQGSNRNFVLSVDSGNNRELYESIVPLTRAELPTGEAFWSPQAVVQNNGLYVLQNLVSNGNVTGRTLLEFKNGAWRALN